MIRITVADQPTRRVVITGLGVISPIGNSREEFWQSLVQGRSGITRSPDRTGGPSECAGEVRDFRGKIDDFGDLDKDLRKAIRKSLKLMNRETQMAVAAAQQAIEESQIKTAGLDPERIGVCFGSGNVSMEPEDFLEGIQSCFDDDSSFDFARWGSHGIEQVAPLWMLKCLANMPSCHIAIYHDFRGPNNTITQRETSANLAVTEACNLILDGDLDAAVAGATGTMMLPLSMIHAMVETDVAPGQEDPTRICRPFDRDRCGAVVGEGAAVIVLEELSVAVRRGASIYGEIKGCGSSCVVDKNRDPHVDTALTNAMHAALRKAQMSPDQVGHLNAHGLSARQSDIDEASAIRNVFGDGAEHLPVVAVKSYVGNSGAGTGAIELVASLLALDRGRLFRVLNYENPDPACPIAAVTSSDVEAKQSFLNLSTVSQGQASCLLVGSLN